jgi:CMP-N-acetylneuraminic acid synthetase
MNILLTICARGGSKGVPRKNIRLLNGKPLINYTIKVAKEFAEKFGAHIVISTDDKEISSVAAECGISGNYQRPNILATDQAGKLDAINDVLIFQEKEKGITYDYILDLDVTSPLRNLNDLSEAFLIFNADKEANNLLSVNPANRNPYFNMVEEQPSGYFSLIKKGNFLTRQSSPQVYDLNASFYFYRRRFFSRKLNVVNDKTLVYIMPHICFDLDHEIDFVFMEFLIVNNKLGFLF